jgi:hypothetical protein
VSMKNALFNENVKKQKMREGEKASRLRRDRPGLKRVK